MVFRGAARVGQGLAPMRRRVVDYSVILQGTRVKMVLAETSPKTPSAPPAPSNPGLATSSPAHTTVILGSTHHRPGADRLPWFLLFLYLFLFFLIAGALPAQPSLANHAIRKLPQRGQGWQLGVVAESLVPCHLRCAAREQGPSMRRLNILPEPRRTSSPTGKLMCAFWLRSRLLASRTGLVF